MGWTHQQIHTFSLEWCNHPGSSNLFSLGAYINIFFKRSQLERLWICQDGCGAIFSIFALYNFCMCQHRDSSPKVWEINVKWFVWRGSFFFFRQFSPDFLLMRFINRTIFCLMLTNFLPVLMEETSTNSTSSRKLLEFHEPGNVQELNILFDRKNGLAPGKYYQAEILRLDSLVSCFIEFSQKCK